jgi:hypothetical protein
MITLLVFFLGLGCGSLAQGFLWAGKAKGPMRKEWFGKLYQVTRDYDDEGAGA